MSIYWVLAVSDAPRLHVSCSSFSYKASCVEGLTDSPIQGTSLSVTQPSLIRHQTPWQNEFLTCSQEMYGQEWSPTCSLSDRKVLAGTDEGWKWNHTWANNGNLTKMEEWTYAQHRLWKWGPGAGNWSLTENQWKDRGRNQKLRQNNQAKHQMQKVQMKVTWKWALYSEIRIEKFRELVWIIRDIVCFQRWRWCGGCVLSMLSLHHPLPLWLLLE
jgi:hypothetical protein